MTSRERVLQTLNFEPTDRPPFDLMEGIAWPALAKYFKDEHGVDEDMGAIVDFLDTDFRWVQIRYDGPVDTTDEKLQAGYTGTYSEALFERALGKAQTIAEVEAYDWPKLEWWTIPDFAEARAKYPDHALTYLAGWQPLFCNACNAFGMETALMHMVARPDLFEAFVVKQHELYMGMLKKAMDAGMQECDIVWIGDDYASGDALMMPPDTWRQLIKPYLAKQVEYLRNAGLYVIFHSCGNVREILPDFIDIGINAHVVFQTSARNMEAASIAREFGGKLAFYGGIDCQHLLTFGTPQEVADTVRSNARHFADCGGYIVSNCHHCIDNIRGENILAMCRAARDLGAEK